MEEREIDKRIDITTSIELTKAKKLDHGEVEVIVSNSGIDRHGESITMEGIDLKQVKKNPVVLWAHDYGGLPIAKIVKLWKSGGNLMARLKFATERYDFADTVYRMVVDGFISAVSIGGIIKAFAEEKDGKTDYSVIAELEMVELSVVPVGAHPDALVTGKSFDMKKKDIKKQYEDFLYRSMVDKMGKNKDNTLDEQIKALKSLLTALESAYKATSKDTDNSKETKPEKAKRIRKLVIVRNSAKQVDKQSELIISSISNLLKD